MELSDWVNKSIHDIRQHGVYSAKKSLFPVYRKIIEQGRWFQPEGDNILYSDWDLLIVVDACRMDLMEQIGPAYEFVSTIGSRWSLDSTTAMWMERTFEGRETSDILYVCGNPFSADKLNESEFDELVEVWKNVWSEPGTVPPRSVTDIAIERMRSRQPTRTIVHYLQPHCPFIPMPHLSKGKDVNRFGNQGHRDVWERYRDGDISLEDLWRGYQENLRLVMDDIDLLLENVDANNVVITSDHGNALGKWGIYGHPPRMPHKSLREVPWIETSATDTGDYIPELGSERPADVDRKEQLRALGYA